MAKIVVKEIEVSIGLSADMGGVWVKPTVTMRVELNEVDAKQREKVFAKVWKEVNEQVQNQLEEKHKELNS